MQNSELGHTGKKRLSCGRAMHRPKRGVLHTARKQTSRPAVLQATTRARPGSLAMRMHSAQHRLFPPPAFRGAHCRIVFWPSGDYVRKPPLTLRTSPVMNCALSEHRK